MEFDFETRTRHVEKKIAELERKDFLPQELVHLVKRTILRQIEARRNTALVLPDPGDLTPAGDNLMGKPLLERERFPFDRDQAAGLFLEFLDILAEAGGETRRAAEVIRQALDQGTLDRDRCFAAFLGSDPKAFAQWAALTPGTPRAVNYLTQAALGPSLEAAGFALSQHLSKDGPRQHGHCPVCGSLPFLAVLQGKEGFRFLTCSFCRTEYRTRRLACSYCDESDPTRLGFFDTEEGQGFRLDVCNTCQCYIKTADFRTMDKVAVPELDDLVSLPLDFLAQGRGYKRPVLSSWGF